MNKYLIAALAMLSSPMLSASAVVDCENARTTIEINQCAGMALESAQAVLAEYLQASFENHADDPELVAAIKTAQKDWQAYMTSHCDAVYTQWRDGSIRGVMTLSCKTQLTKQRTHEIWANFLTYMDSTAPVLPEPESN
ncbi:MAG: lysozyme inhibitor LprI family protein [Reinekea sp.]|nr:lysozyme inhibitor LprI family protein [Reinekea sp.]